MPETACWLESDLGIAAIRSGIAQVGVETGRGLAFREDALDRRRSDRPSIAASAQRRRRIDASDRGGMARPALDARHRDRLAVNNPELMAAFRNGLRKPFAARQRSVRNCLAQEGDGPVGK